MERKQASPARKPWELSVLAWTAGGIAAVCCLLHSVYQHERRVEIVSTAALGSVTVGTYMRIGWPLPFAEGKKADSEDNLDETLTHDLSQLTSIEFFPLGGAVDLLVLIVFSFSAAYATERLQQHLRPQVTITGLLGISTLAAWEVQTVWKPLLAIDGGHDAPRQIEMLLVGNWGYSARIMRFLTLVACFVFADIVARVIAGKFWTRGADNGQDSVAGPTRSRPRWSLFFAGICAVFALLFQTVMNPRWQRSDEGYWDRLEIGWPVSALAGNIPDDRASSWLAPGSATSSLQNISSITPIPIGLATDAFDWSLLIFTAAYGVNWLLQKAGGRFPASCVCGLLLFFCLDACIHLYSVYGTRIPEWSDALVLLLVSYNAELLQFLIFASCLFIPHMAFTLLGKLVSAMKPKPPRAEQAQTG